MPKRSSWARRKSDERYPCKYFLSFVSFWPSLVFWSLTIMGRHIPLFVNLPISPISTSPIFPTPISILVPILVPTLLLIIGVRNPPPPFGFLNIELPHCIMPRIRHHSGTTHCCFQLHLPTWFHFSLHVWITNRFGSSF